MSPSRDRQHTVRANGQQHRANFYHGPYDPDFGNVSVNVACFM